jgi:hypothetical protein
VVTYFEYEAIYLGIIVGLALANVLMSFHKLVEAGARVRWGWFAPASALYAAVLTLAEFWSFFPRQHGVGHRFFLTWLPTALAFALLFLMCAASLPDDAGEGIDLRRYYFANRKRLWGFALALHLLSLLSWAVGAVEKQPDFPLDYIQQNWVAVSVNVIDALLSLALMFVRPAWLQATLLSALVLSLLAAFGTMRLY